MRPSISFRQRCFLLAALLLVLLLPGRIAHAQLQNGQIQGTITNRTTGRPLGGVTVVVTGPSLQGEQTEFTDPSGRYEITELPPGDNYIVRFYFNDVIVERPGIRVTQNKTLTVSLAMPTQRGDKKAYVIRERAPNVDTAGSDTRVEINQELLKNTAVRGRTFESVIALAPGATDVAPHSKDGVIGGDVGVSVSGSVGNENNFLIDGLNTTDPNLGVIGTELNNYFIKEANVITGGYQAEYGRATGGVISVVTKSGSNEFHGGVFASYAPFQLQPSTVARLGEALGTRRRMNNEYDFGFDLGGPIVKDRIWFYVGFAPTVTNFRTERVVRQQSFDPATGKAMTDPGYECPSYLSFSGFPGGCNGPKKLALSTTELGQYTRNLDEQQQSYNWIAKLQFNLSPDHNITLSYIGNPQKFDGYASLRNDLSANKYTQTDQIHDASLRYIGKLLDRKLQLELMYGYHYQNADLRPQVTDKPAIQYEATPDNPYSLADFEDVPDCRRQMVKGPTGATLFNPCPLTQYQNNGYGYYNHTLLQRHVLLASATYFLRLLGNHAWKLGFDFEDNSNDNFRTYSGTDLNPNDPLAGHRYYQTTPDGSQLQVAAGYARANPNAGQPGQLPYTELNGFEAQTQTRNYALYLRDSWNVGFAPGLVLNLGVRWEAQEIFGSDGTKQISIYDNWAPRVGLAYDFTRKGRSKLSFNYGRFYESVPLDINDRQFSGEGIITTDPSANCPTASSRDVNNPRQLPTPTRGAGTPCTFPNYVLNGGTYAQVAPSLKGQFINEIVASFQYDVGLDVVLGVSYIHRDLGNIIEDMSTDGGSFYIIGNPGAAADAGVVKDLEAQAQAASDRLNANPQSVQAQNDLATANSRLAAYKAVGTVFPKARRDYNAVQFTAQKRLSNRFSVLSNYTYSRTIGNYPGTFSASNGQLDPNISTQFDLVDLLANRTGPLPTDRPHNFKLTGFYVQPIGTRSSLTGSLTFTAYSGRPIEVLGFHPTYFNREVFILPRGSGGRTPTVTQFDVHVGYEHELSKNIRLDVYADVINLFNQKAVTNVDDEYTTSTVAPILNGKPEDILHLRTSNGSPLVVNSNYGAATAYQAPLFLRLGAALSF